MTALPTPAPSGPPVADPWPVPRVHGPVDVAVTLPGSKSLTNRALVLAALADGPSVVAPGAALPRHAADGVGADGPRAPTSTPTAMTGRSVPAPFERAATVDCGLAGTVMRFVPPVAALSTADVTFDGDPHMRVRPIGEMLTALRGLGVAIDDGGRGALPFTIAGRGAVRGGTVVIDASASSQFVSALLLAGARYDDGVDVRHVGKPVPSLPHIEMTVAMLRRHGVAVDDADANRWAVAPGPGPRRRPHHRARPVQRRAVPGAGRGDPAARVVGARLAARDHPGRRRAARDPHPDGVRGALRRRRPRGARHRPVAGRRRRPARRRRADARRRGPLRAGRDAVAPARRRAHPRPRDRPAGRARRRARRARRRRHRAGRRARPPPRARCTAASSTPTPTTGWPTPASILGAAVDDVRSRTSPRRPRPSPTSPASGTDALVGVTVGRGGRRMTGRYDEHDHEHYERPRRRTRPRTKERPTYDDAVDGERRHRRPRPVHRCLLDDGTAVMAMKSRPLGRKGVVVGDRVRVVGDVSGHDGLAGPDRGGAPPDDGAAPYGRRRRPRRADHRGQRRPAGRRDGAGRPRASHRSGRPRAGGGVRRGDGAAAVPDQGGPRPPGRAARRPTARSTCPGS